MAKLKILLAEDESISRELMEKILTPIGVVTSTSNGKAALDAFLAAWEENQPYELVVLDIMMPEMDGHTVLKEIRAYEAAKGFEDGENCAKVLMTTCLEDEDNFLKAHSVGLEWYITKPIDRKGLYAVLQDLGLISNDL